MHEDFVPETQVICFLTQCRETVAEAEKRYDYQYSSEQLEKCMRYTIRKARLNDKPDDYIPLLFKDEINFIPRIEKEVA